MTRGGDGGGEREALLTLGCCSLRPVTPPSHPRDGGENRVGLAMSRTWGKERLAGAPLCSLKKGVLLGVTWL